MSAATSQSCRGRTHEPFAAGRRRVAGLRSRHAMSTSVVDPPAQCPNCGAVLEGKYCSQCGQKVTSLNPTLGEVLHDLVHEIVHVDGKIITTLRYLIAKPGFLSLEHFEGRRARYVAPIRLYLLLSVLCFGATALTPDTGFRLSCTSCPADIRAER